MKRRKPIDPQGHRERPGLVPVAVECEACHDVRRKGEPWRVPCSRSDKEWPPKYLGEAAG